MIISTLDNVEVNIENGHKYALCDIEKGENIIKYGMPIGHATEKIKRGEHIHTHNLRTNLSGKIEYTYNRKEYAKEAFEPLSEINAYIRESGEIGIRNEIWIVNTVGCVNKTAQILSEKTGARYFSHPYGCSQLGGDLKTTQLILRGLVRHPNAAGVLVVGLGCENNNIDEFCKILGCYDKNRVRFLNCQNAADEVAEGIRLIGELEKYAAGFRRERVSAAHLKIGLKCGGSDGLSGITANPLVGRVSDWIIACGGSCVLTEVPEMFGAEQLLMERCINESVFEKTVRLINGFKEYYQRHNQVIYENPSPGNKEGGITTLEEKSLGCVQKGGVSPVVDVLSYGDTIQKSGLSLLDGPGNDMCAVTNLTAAGVHMILFTTGRGTPLGAPVPTLKISSNKGLYERKKNWIDFDASAVLENGFGNAARSLADKIVAVAGGEKTLNEKNGYSEIAIFKDGVTL